MNSFTISLQLRVNMYLSRFDPDEIPIDSFVPKAKLVTR